MLNRIRALLDRWHRLQEVDTLTDHDLADLGMTRTQVRAFAAMPADVPDRVAAMAAIFGIPNDDLKANHAEYLELLGTCAACHDRAACARLLRDGALSRPSDAGFCPNAPTYAEHSPRAA